MPFSEVRYRKLNIFSGNLEPPLKGAFAATDKPTAAAFKVATHSYHANTISLSFQHVHYHPDHVTVRMLQTETSLRDYRPL